MDEGTRRSEAKPAAGGATLAPWEHLGLRLRDVWQLWSPHTIPSPGTPSWRRASCVGFERVVHPGAWRGGVPPATGTN